jgi:C-terminal processing protease CtpA/Prc
MLRLLLSFLMIVTLSQAQHKKVITKIITDEGDKTEALVRVEVEDNMLKFRIEKDGDVQEFEVDSDDQEALAEMEKTLDELCVNVHIKGIHDKHMAFEGKSGFLGVHIQDLGEQLREYFKVKGNTGVLVSEVEEDSPADKAGLKAGDIILKVDDEDVSDADDLTRAIRSYDPGAEVALSILRNGRKKSIHATLGETEDRFLAMKHPFSARGPRAKMFKYGKPFEHFDEDFDADDLIDGHMKHYMFLKDSALKDELKDLKDEIREIKKELKELRSQ